MTQVLDGAVIAERLKAQLPKLTATLGVVMVGDDKDSEIFVNMKTRRAHDYGLDVRLIRLRAESSIDDVCAAIREFNENKLVNGVVLQLPLPPELRPHTAKAIAEISPIKDVDAIGESGYFTSPMVFAAEAYRREYDIQFSGKRVAVVGSDGWLIGQPICKWLESRGIEPLRVEKDTPRSADVIRSADIVINGAPVPGLINPSNTRPGQIVLDCACNAAFDELNGYVAAITPRKNGFGRLVVHFVLANTLNARLHQFERGDLS